MNWADQTAKSDFERAHMKSFWNEIRSKFKQTNNKLLPFDEVSRIFPQRGQYDLGMKEIPIENIVGSVNRSNDFDRAFLPRDDHDRGRWENVDKARLKDIELPAIEVYKIGEVYFVIDGNHRVSVAREKGQAFIDAHVTHLEIPIQITPDMDWDDIIIRKERKEFLEQTNINHLIQNNGICLTQIGGYSTLLEHISVHRWFMGEQHGHEISLDRAVVSWYRRVYMNFVKVIRKRNILKDFPGRTETDLYLWISRHHYFMAEDVATKIPLDVAATHFVNKYSQRPLRRMRYWLRRIRKGLIHLWNKISRTI
jgi:hypothetical protein